MSTRSEIALDAVFLGSDRIVQQSVKSKVPGIFALTLHVAARG